MQVIELKLFNIQSTMKEYLLLYEKLVYFIFIFAYVKNFHLLVVWMNNKGVVIA